jgi:hypothetical protein
MIGLLVALILRYYRDQWRWDHKWMSVGSGENGRDQNIGEVFLPPSSAPGRQKGQSRPMIGHGQLPWLMPWRHRQRRPTPMAVFRRMLIFVDGPSRCRGHERPQPHKRTVRAACPHTGHLLTHPTRQRLVGRCTSAAWELHADSRRLTRWSSPAVWPACWRLWSWALESSSDIWPWQLRDPRRRPSASMPTTLMGSCKSLVPITIVRS